MRRPRRAQVLFKVYRHLPRSKQTRPVMVHINYHPGALRATRRLPGARLVSRRACRLAAAEHPWAACCACTCRALRARVCELNV
jgi:hypothetical protein